MSAKTLSLVFRNLFRSRTRLLATAVGCAIGAAVICFFSAAENSLDRMMNAAGGASNLIAIQKDRY
ncbi:MAG: hypothetical protein ACYTGB_08800 [Planctomycetota bacterium]|jgi:hypothetical protein